MFNIDTYITNLTNLLKDTFGVRLVYLGLQGSYARNEQTASSDIDIMAVIDNISVKDLDLYKNALIKNGSYEKSCGFICGQKELSGWNPLEICHLLHTTKDIYGNLEKLVPAYTIEDEKNYIRLSIGNLYHELCHRYIHSGYEENKACLPETCKQVFFILQNLFFVKKGIFYNSKTELADNLWGQDKEVLSLLLNMQNGCEINFESAFNLLFSWCRNTLAEL